MNNFNSTARHTYPPRLLIFALILVLALHLTAAPVARAATIIVTATTGTARITG